MKNLERFNENNSSLDKSLANVLVRNNQQPLKQYADFFGSLSDELAKLNSEGFKHESLILAQDERWRRA